LAAESVLATSSGIGRVARLMARALAHAVGESNLRVIALRSGDLPALPHVPLRSAHGSRLRFVAETHRAALHARCFFYDFAGIARAHCRLPLLQRPYAVWCHGIEVWEDARRDRLAALAGAKLLFANSSYTQQRAARLHPDLARARVCWLGTETDDAPALAAPTEGPPTVTILSRLDEHGGYKGHRELIEAWPSVVSAVSEARLVIAGAGPGSGVISQWVAASSARGHIELPGFVAEQDIPALWSRTTAFAMPSRGEGFGLAYIEAMRHAVPVIASVHDAAPEINLDGVTGHNVDLDRRGELAERIIGVLRNRDRARTLGLAGQARWREHFTYSAFERRFLPLATPLLDHVA
jgi:phosphatidyl-myo-inositol dimannoside synthase